MGAGDDICTDPEQGRGGVREASSSAPTWAQPPCPHGHLAHPNQTPVPKASSQSSAQRGWEARRENLQSKSSVTSGSSRPIKAHSNTHWVLFETSRPMISRWPLGSSSSANSSQPAMALEPRTEQGG